MFVDFQAMACFFARDIWYPQDEGVCLEFEPYIWPIVAAIPPLIRITQCLRRFIDTHKAFPHLVNAGKYSSSLLVIAFNAWYRKTSSTPSLVLWVVSATVATAYAFTWDIKMDWGLFEKGNAQFLRSRLIYPAPFTYYYAAVSNLVMRILWIFTITPTTIVGVQDVYARTFLLGGLSLIEIFRRIQWNFFRLENEHLNNCGEFRVSRQVPVSLDTFPKEQMEAVIEKIVAGSGPAATGDTKSPGTRDGSRVRSGSRVGPGSRSGGGSRIGHTRQHSVLFADVEVV